MLNSEMHNDEIINANNTFLFDVIHLQLWGTTSRVSVRKSCITDMSLTIAFLLLNNNIRIQFCL